MVFNDSHKNMWTLVRKETVGLLGGSVCVEVVHSAPNLCSHQLTHQSMIMAQLVSNSWTTMGEGLDL